MRTLSDNFCAIYPPVFPSQISSSTSLSHGGQGFISFQRAFFGGILPRANVAFVCQMEDVLGVYKRPYEVKRPLICMDEMPKQLLAGTREPVTCQPGIPSRQDYEYKLNGVEDLFMLFEPLQGNRYVEVKEQRRRVEWAGVMK